MTIQTVIFDMGGTIDTYWHSPEMRLHATPELLDLMSSCGMHLSLSSAQLYEMIANGLARYHQWRLASLDELPASTVWRDYIFEGYPGTVPQLESIGDDLMVWLETHYYKRTMRPEIPSVLETIRSMGYKIGLISNVNSRGQVPLNLKQYGIHHYFDPIVLSSEYMRRKPDPAIFHHAARLSNTPTSECIYIGDRVARDVLGAKRAGFKMAIQIHHDFVDGTDEGAIPDVKINNMTELLDILQMETCTPRKLEAENSSDGKIRAILFDADGVLYYRKSRDQELNSFIRLHAKGDPANLGDEIERLRHQAFIGKLTFEQYKTAVLQLYGITNPELVAQGIQAARLDKDGIDFFSGTRQTLETLKGRKYYLGIITDTTQPLSLKINKLERGGFGHMWDTIIPSNEVGVQKPSPCIYQLALRQLGIQPGQAIFVGHKTSELEGARIIGMQTVAFNYDTDANADFYINNFSDLAALPILN
jgi:putative hydrolase of the HAD superfamily